MKYFHYSLLVGLHGSQGPDFRGEGVFFFGAQGQWRGRFLFHVGCCPLVGCSLSEDVDSETSAPPRMQPHWLEAHRISSFEAFSS